ncbi:efflux RND transporter permease subunit [Pontibacter akesuensis]|uniref:Multidrug efflux pump n=1 Tax=Pontibacter akesuensis TaxID=388950 RepID=A0A1I7JZ35_9BACT|nr:efflux RND transporter permease subunit [Pontibacter akesuensis]GHA76385.1 acriflavin resistance protein [Pontibacter akesuensis]SFU90453.1 multidrug efflux pump [Pontibacter akesuensis]
MASLSNISIKRPVLAIVMSITIMVFGFIGITYLGVREYPSVDPPIINVRTSYTGANAETIESEITEPLEESINGIAGIRTLTSSSSEGSSNITVEFNLNVDLETAANDVRDRVARAQRRLPEDAEPPTVSKADADANPIIMLGVKSETRSLLELSDIGLNVFKEQLQTIPGVSEIMIWGDKRYSMRLWMDPDKLAALQVTPLEVQNALVRQNVELPSGSIEGASTELSVRTMGRISTVEDFNNLVVRQDDTRLIRFQDIGYAQLAPENEKTVLRYNGVPMIGVVLVPQPGSNQIEIADEFYKRLEHIKKDIPEDLELIIGFDNSQYIRASISEVEETIYVALGLVVIIIFLFLRDWRSTLIPVVAIPVSLIGSFFIMYVMDFSINVLTLLAVVLAIGLVVDDAIVMLENIYARIEKGEDPRSAAKKGSSEIYFAIISTTVALAAVFMPVAFLEDTTGRLFREFGIVIAGSVIISSFVSLTLTPMMSSRILKHRERPNWFYRKTEPFFTSLTDGYRSSLESFMKVRWVAFVLVILSAGAIWWQISTLQSELTPDEDRSGLRINATGPEGASYEFMDKYMNELTALVNDSVQGIASITSLTRNSNSGFIRLRLVDPDKREKSQQQIVDELPALLNQIPGARAFASGDKGLGGGRGSGQPVQFVVQSQSMEKLREVIPPFLEAAQADPTFQFVDVNLKFNKPELRVEILREKAQSLGVSVRDIAQTMQLGLSGQRFGYFVKGGKQYQILGQVSRENRSEPLDLRSLYVKSSSGELIQLDNLIELSEESASPQVYRFNRFASATFSASLAKGKTIGDGVEAMDAIADQVLDETYQTSLTGQSRDFSESSGSLLFAFLLALGLIYLALSAQFESFRDPVIIMFTVPLALAGALVSLWYFDETMNIFSQIGMIMLVGLVTKNGILLVEFANQRKEEGLTKLDAAVDSAVSRFRPILMTSLSTILGTLPIALALGAGSESRASMGIAVVGGLIFATGLTLYVIPAVYSYFSSNRATRVEDTEEEMKPKTAVKA